MGELEIVLVDPAKEQSQEREKRPRLVTSCDHCRLKRTGCVRNTDRCDCCTEAGVDCTFGDVDDYLNRRKLSRQNLAPYSTARPKAGSLKVNVDCGVRRKSRSRKMGSSSPEVTSPSSSISSTFFSPTSPSSSTGSASYSTSRTRPSIIPSMGPRPALFSSPQPLNWVHPRSEVPFANTTISNPGGHPQAPIPSNLQNILPSSTYFPVYQPPTHNPPQIVAASPENAPGEFFDPYRPGYPHPKYLKQFITDFDKMGNDWYGLDTRYIWETFKNGTLSPMLANSIAAISARYREWPELSSGTQSHRSSTGERYCEAAKHHMRARNTPCLDTLYSATLIAWSEYGSDRSEKFCEYTNMAIGVLRQLGFTPDAKGIWAEEDQRRLQLSWWAIARMDSVRGWLTWKPMTLALAADDATQGPYVSVDSQYNSSPLATLTEWKRTILPFRKRMQGLLDSHRCQGLPIGDFPHNLKALSNDLTCLWSLLPSCMIFNPQNLASYSRLGTAAEYVLVHLNFHMIMIMANCPSVIRGFEGMAPGNLDASSYSAKLICEILAQLRLANQRTALLMPCLDLYISAATRALLRDVQSPDVRYTEAQSPRRRYLEGGISLCREVLMYMTGFWRHVDSVQNVLAKRPMWTYQAHVDEGHLGSFQLTEPELFGESQYPVEERSPDQHEHFVYTPPPTSSLAGSASSNARTNSTLLLEPEMIPRSSSIEEQPQSEWHAFVGRLDSRTPAFHLKSTDVQDSAATDAMWRV